MAETTYFNSSLTATEMENEFTGIKSTTGILYSNGDSTLRVATLNDTGGIESGVSTPTTSKVGYVGKIYFCTTDKKLYACTAVSGSTYTWEEVSGGGGSAGGTYIYVRYSATQPTQDTDMKTTPDAWMGIHTGTETTAPTHYTDYTWYKIKGDDGSAGSAATIAVGTVTTGAAGTSATVVNSGTSSAAVFDFTIPRGADGSSGTWGSITGDISSQTDLQDALGEKYEKPSTGIPKTDLASAVQTSLGLADTALQSHQSLSAYRTSADQDDIDDEIKGTWLTATLSASATTVTFTDSSIGSTSIIDVYTDTFGVNPTAMTISGTTLTLTFTAQSSAVSVKVQVR